MTDRSLTLPGTGPTGMAAFFGSNVPVTQDDLANGVRGSGPDCPIALAIRREFPKVTAIDLSGEMPWVKIGDQPKQTIRLAPDVVAWIGRYDRGEPVEPINFSVSLPLL